jgi:hypothetical protein
MVDKNGRQIQTGDVVLVSGGYFKSDNGLFAVNAGSWRTKMDAKSWNAANAEILVVDDVNHSYIAENFMELAEHTQVAADLTRQSFGDDYDEVKRLENLKAFYISVADRAAAAN